MAPPMRAKPAPVRNSHCFRLRLSNSSFVSTSALSSRWLRSAFTLAMSAPGREFHEQERRFVVVDTE